MSIDSLVVVRLFLIVQLDEVAQYSENKINRSFCCCVIF